MTTPSDLRAGGQRLWEDVTGRYELDEHEARLLYEAARTADQLDDLADIVARDGPLAESGAKVHPALIEARAQRLAYARIISTLRLPEHDEAPADRPQRRGGSRGFYSVGGAA